jgi:hypothetical protein
MMATRIVRVEADEVSESSVDWLEAEPNRLAGCTDGVVAGS